ncbi:MAG: site-2 protease family protein [Campylobacteraceae bacterium]
MNIEIVNVTFLIVCLIIAIVGHEYMHGKVANYYGDDTAKNLGRLSINPIKHIDPFGTIIVPLLLYFTTGFVFGWAKPVPINTRTVLENGGLKGAVLVSLAGIIYNFLIAMIAFVIFKDMGASLLKLFLLQLFFINIFLGLFNLYPFPPLDGSRALAYILAGLGFIKAANFLLSQDKIFMVILIVVLISPLSKYFFMPIMYVLNLFLA